MKKNEPISHATMHGDVELALEKSLWVRKTEKYILFIQGFTLIELMLVVAIIGIVVSIAIPSYKAQIDKKDAVLAAGDIAMIAECLHRHSILNRNKYPDNLADSACSVGDDPWDHAYEYLNIANVKGNGKLRKDHGNVPINTKFDLYSKGKDGLSVSPLTAKHSRDDVVYGRDGRFIGLGKNF